MIKLDRRATVTALWWDRDARDIYILAMIGAKATSFKEHTETYPPGSLQASSFVLEPGRYLFNRSSGPGLVRWALGGDALAQDAAELVGMKALERLTSPSEFAGPFDGRLLARVDGGYVVLNPNALGGTR